MTGESTDGDLAEEDLTRLPVDGDDRGRGEHLLAAGHAHGLAAASISRVSAPHTAGLAHATGDDGGVAGLAATSREHTGGRHHTGQVVGVGLAAHENDVLTLLGTATASSLSKTM